MARNSCSSKAVLVLAALFITLVSTYAGAQETAVVAATTTEVQPAAAVTTTTTSTNPTAAVVTPAAVATGSTTEATETPLAATAGATAAAAVTPAAATTVTATAAAAVTPTATATGSTAASATPAATATATPAASAKATTEEAPAAEDAAATTDAAEESKPAAKAPAGKRKAKAKSRSKPKPKAKAEKIVAIAPEATITNDDDIDPEGKCADDIDTFCKEVELGEGRVADCLSDQIAEQEVASTKKGDAVSSACREEVFDYKIERSTNINKNIPLAKACKLDAEKHCNVTWFFGYKNGSIISCLRDVKDKLRPKCRKEVFKVQLAASQDFRADPSLYEACKKDAETLCKDISHGGGRVQACLRDKHMQLSWDCEEQLFRKDMEDSDDIRLSVRFFQQCLSDKKQFCPQVAPGHAAAKQCLEEHRMELSTPCKEEVDSMIERRVRDFRLDSNLRQVCEGDIFNMCSYLGDLDTMDTYDATVINCLQDYNTEIQDEECKAQVNKYLQLAAEDIRFDVPLADACYEDRRTLCASVPPGSARVIRCLQNQRDKLTTNCRVTLFDEEVRFSENIDFQYPMKKVCAQEVDMFCKDVPHGSGRVIRCLQDNKNNKDFGKACREEVKRYEVDSAKDYRLNFRLKRACNEDVRAICKDICSLQEGEVCGGKVLHCLTENKESIKSPACKKEVFYYEKMEVSDFRVDATLAETCRFDVNKFCPKVQPGEGRVHKCLREHSEQLSEACRREELRLEQTEAESIELNQGLLKACRDERALFCKDVMPGSARVFRCLADNLGDSDYGDACKYQVIMKLQRRQSNWRLDPPLRKACKEDVAEVCDAADSKRSEQGLVFKCMIANYTSLSEGCQRELGRSVHMAFYIWAANGIITAPCDSDVTEYCLSKGANAALAKQPGAVGTCLARILEAQAAAEAPALAPARRLLGDGKDKEDDDDDKAEEEMKAAKKSKKKEAVKAANAKPKPPPELSEQCRILADIAEPPNVKRAFDASLSFALIQNQLEGLEQGTGLELMTRNHKGMAQGLSLTGWTALAGIAAMVLLLVFGGMYALKRYRGVSDNDYTLVVKTQPK